MDSSRTTDRAEVLDTDSEGTGGGRDLRDVLRHLVVTDGSRENVSLSAIARAAKGTERLLPELLDALEADATAVRAGAAWALCALADDQPEAVEYLAARLTERVDGEESFEVGQVLAYLRGRYPARVADAIDVAVAVEGLDDGADAASTTARPGAPGSVADPQTGAPARAESGPDKGKRIETDGGVPAGTVADLGDGRQVVRPGDRDSSNRPATPTVPAQRGVAHAGPPHRRPSGPRSPPRDHPTHPDFESDGDQADSTTTPGRAETHSSAETTPATDERPSDTAAEDRAKPDTFAAIGSLSSLDRLSAVDTGVEERYARGYRCRAVSDDEEHGVEVRLFDRPEDERLAFQADLEDCLARWQALDDAASVVSVSEWGTRPRPWVRTEAVDTSLAARGQPPVDEAVDQAIDLAGAVADLHARGGVHGGIDPKNVVYPCDPLAALEHPMLDNVGMMGVFRRYFEPAKYLDPRFAAPEYFDDDFGTVDAATDVYGLGSVVFYLLTGRPPFVGSYSEIRQGVLKSTLPAPSEATEEMIPASLDTVVGKALAKEKIKRYDGVESMVRDLEQVRSNGR